MSYGKIQDCTLGFVIFALISLTDGLLHSTCSVSQKAPDEGRPTVCDAPQQAQMLAGSPDIDKLYTRQWFASKLVVVTKSFLFLLQQMKTKKLLVLDFMWIPLETEGQTSKWTADMHNTLGGEQSFSNFRMCFENHIHTFKWLSDVPFPLLCNDWMQAPTSPFQSHLKDVPLVAC